MRRRLLALSLAAFSMLFAAGLRAQVSPRDLWPQVTAALDAGDMKTADQKLAELLDTGRDLGIRRFPLYADSAASLARQTNRAQNGAEVSKWAMAAALKLDPKSADVMFTAADLAVEQKHWGAALTYLARGATNVWADFTTSLVSRMDLAELLALTITCCAALFGLILFLRYARPASHDLRELLGGRFKSAGAVTVIAFALLFAPVFLWLGPVWLLLYWFVLFFGYAQYAERAIIIVFLVLLACVPLGLDWSAYRLAASNSPAVRAADASIEHLYHPDTLRRIRELAEMLPEDPKVQLLVGNLEMQDGDDAAALIRFKRATELNERFAGAQLNIGNLHFSHNDFQAAISQYEKAIAADPNLAIAYFNKSVASGEIYRYDEQGRQLEEAKKRDRALIDRLLSNPSSTKIVNYDLPMSEAWRITDSVGRQGSARELFGNYATFDFGTSFMNIVTLGSLLAIAAAIALWAARRKNGYAGICMKCGRTFCYRCKSARESATYCTQCIHIYLKRDGVSLDTKRQKLEEVQGYQSSRVKVKKILGTFFPGSAQILDGNTVRGTVILLVFIMFVLLAILVGRLAPISTPAETVRLVLRVAAIVAAVVMWLLFTIPVYRHRPVSG